MLEVSGYFPCMRSTTCNLQQVERVAKMVEFVMKMNHRCTQCSMKVLEHDPDKYFIQYDIHYDHSTTFGYQPKVVITEMWRQGGLSAKQAPNNKRLIDKVKGLISDAKVAMASQDWKLGELQLEVQSTAAKVQAEAEAPLPLPEAPAETKEPAPEPEPPATAPHNNFCVGDKVFVFGLEKRSDINGMKGTVVGYIQEKDRLKVETSNGKYNISPKNLTNLEIPAPEPEHEPAPAPEPAAAESLVQCPSPLPPACMAAAAFSFDQAEEAAVAFSFDQAEEDADKRPSKKQRTEEDADEPAPKFKPGDIVCNYTHAFSPENSEVYRVLECGARYATLIMHGPNNPDTNQIIVKVCWLISFQEAFAASKRNCESARKQVAAAVEASDKAHEALELARNRQETADNHHASLVAFAQWAPTRPATPE